MTITKATTTANYSVPGNPIAYTYTVTNTGLSTLTGVQVADNPMAPATGLTSGPTCSSGTCTGVSSTTLTAGQSAVFDGTYDVSQADIDNGNVTDTATATGTLPSSATITANSNKVVVNASQAGAISITKSASVGSVSAPGPVTYTFTVKNTGNVSLTGATISDSANFGGLSGYSCNNSETNGSIALAVGASETCTATESVTQTQIDAGTSLVDTASVSAATPASDTAHPSVSATSNQVTVTITQIPSLAVLKTASV